MNRVIEFDGRTASLFVEYVNYKRTMGYHITASYQYVLHDINRQLEIYIGGNNPIEISYADMERICARRVNESIRNQCKRITILRQFCLFVRTKGINAASPPMGMVKNVSDFIPHVLTKQEMTKYIAAADKDCHVWAGLAARLSCCCGLRIGEICALKVSDVDTEDATLLIRRSKGDRTRLVPMSASVAEYVFNYMTKENLIGADGEVFLFSRVSGGPWASGNASSVMKNCMKCSGIKKRDGSVPRPHDARHGFAVRSLEQMEKKGYDSYVALPLLAQYLGHADIKSTELYLRFTESSYAHVLDVMSSTSEDVFGGEEL